MAIDQMGNYYDEDTLTEEERRRLQETGSVSPRTAAPTGPVAPDQYNAYIAQNESRNNPNIGYHMPGKSTAYGTYGMTANAYKDVQAANPAFAGRDITSLSPEEQTQAMNTFTQQNTKYLQNYGVEPTQGNLALAHFLGAKGAADFLRDGTISKAAAAANGGEERVRQIAQQRLAMGGSPVSGAAQAPAPVAPNAAQEGAPVRPVQPGVQTDDEGNSLVTLPNGQTQVLGPNGQPLANRGINVEQAAQFDPYAQRLLESANDTKSLMALGADQNAPAWVQQLAQQQATDRLTLERDKDRETAKIKDMAAKGDTTGLARMIGQSKEGSWGRAILFGLLGGSDLAREEIAKMGYGSQLMKGTANGADVVFTTTPGGDPVQGYYASGPLKGQALDDETLGIVAAGGAGYGKTKPDVSTQDVEKTINGQTVKGRVVTTYDRFNRPTTQVESGGKMYSYDGGWKPVSIGTAAEKATAQKQINLAWDPVIKAATAGAEALGKFNAMNGTNFQIAGTAQGGAPIVVDGNTNQVLRPGQGGTITATQGGAGAPVQTGGMTPAQIETQTAVGKAAQEQFVTKTVPALIDEGSNGSSVASIRRQQISLINSNPSILGIYNGKGEGYDRARNLISKLITGAYSDNDELYNDLKKVSGISEGERAALEDFMNLNTTINAKTLKANTGGGQISNAEQKINRDANLSNIANQTPLASLQGLYRSQFAGELAAAKSAFAQRNPDLNTDAKFAAAWSKEQSRLTKAYEGIMEARAEYLKPFRPREGASAAELNAFKDKVFKAFEMYPAPTYNSETGRWSYVTANAERAAARKLIGQ